MDNNNMNVVDYNNIPNNQNNNAQANTQMANSYQQPMNQNINMQPNNQYMQGPVPTMNPGMNEQFNQGTMPQQPMNSGVVDNNVPIINVEQQVVNPTNMQQPMPQQPMNQVDVQQPEDPKYGYTANEQKNDLNSDSNVNLKVIIFIAILIFAFIMALPYLSNLMDKK